MKSNTKLKKNNIACNRWHTMSCLQHIINHFEDFVFSDWLNSSANLHKENAITLPKFGKTETVQ